MTALRAAAVVGRGEVEGRSAWVGEIGARFGLGGPLLMAEDRPESVAGLNERMWSRSGLVEPWPQWQRPAMQGYGAGWNGTYSIPYSFASHLMARSNVFCGGGR